MELEIKFFFCKSFYEFFLKTILGKFRKLKVVRSEDAAKENGGFLSKTKFEHHNFTAMEKWVFFIIKKNCCGVKVN